MPYIASIKTAVPKYCHSQERLAQFYIDCTDDIQAQRKINIVGKKSGINARYSVLEDFGKNFEDFTFFPKSKNLLPEPTLTSRMRVYKKEAIELSINAVKKIHNFQNIKHNITHIITVTCTGLFAPGLDVELSQRLALNANIHRSSINYLGCNAAIIALKNADAICKADISAKVLVVCTELCTLHFQKDFSDDYILSNMLFGDGSAAVLISNDSIDNEYTYRLNIDSFHSRLVFNGIEGITWQLSEKGFIMNLASYVSDLIKENIGPMLESIAVDPDEIKHWAIHPGGKRILDDFAKALNIHAFKMNESYDVLASNGNMSSATILFILKKMVETNTDLRKNEKIFTAAFGPGLSIETMQLTYA